MLNSSISSHQESYNRQIAWWLIICAAVIFGMILLGGVTRLTDSGSVDGRLETY